MPRPSTSSSARSKPQKRKAAVDDSGSNGIDTNNNDSIMIPLIVTEWLQRRKMKVPEALLSLISTSSSMTTTTTTTTSNVDDIILRYLPGLRERERRALVRHVTKSIATRKTTTIDLEAAAGGSDDGSVGKDKQQKQSAIDELEGSDGEYYEDGNDCVQQRQQISNVENDSNNNSGSGGDESIDCWPMNVEFSNEYKWDDRITNEIKELYRPSNRQQQKQRRRRRSNRRSHKVYIRKILDPAHPAYGGYGLYCALDHAKPGTWLLDYIGQITLGEHQNKSSDYVCDFGTQSELACDALSHGNESRYINDFRNTGKYPNVEFNVRRDSHGELRQGVYVKQVKDMVRGDGNFDGIHRDEELLISYGKNYWRSRVGNLSDFVTVWPNKKRS